ncbi:MAG: hypothetical protein KJ048_00270 [Dehalococcoidia bacterium]|nr:hypothetical protein [Dehalococcoidia bacterium]
MDQPGEGGPSDLQRPDASPWPFLFALSVGMVATAVVWWSNDRDNLFAGLLLVLTLILVLAAAGGWVWEVGHARRPPMQDGEK